MADKGMAEGTANPFVAAKAKEFGGVLGPPTSPENLVAPGAREVLELSPQAQEDYGRLGKSIEGLSGQLQELLETEDQQPGGYEQWVLKGLGINWKARNLERKLAIAGPIYQTISNLEQQRRLYSEPTADMIDLAKKYNARMLEDVKYDELREVIEKIPKGTPGLNWHRVKLFMSGVNMDYTDLLQDPRTASEYANSNRMLQGVDLMAKPFEDREDMSADQKEENLHTMVRAVYGGGEYDNSQLEGALHHATNHARGVAGDGYYAKPRGQAGLTWETASELKEEFHDDSMRAFAAKVGRPFALSASSGDMPMSDSERRFQVRALEEDIAQNPGAWLDSQVETFKNIYDDGGNAAGYLLSWYPHLKGRLGDTDYLPPDAMSVIDRMNEARKK